MKKKDNAWDEQLIDLILDSRQEQADGYTHVFEQVDVVSFFGPQFVCVVEEDRLKMYLWKSPRFQIKISFR